jgi:predicted deacylase
MALKIGTAQAKPGRIAYGTFDLVTFSTGGIDRIPVVIAQGRRAGPCFWFTAGMHGPEHSGLQVIHDLVTPALVRELRGTVVAIPALSPAGLRTNQRVPYYAPGDPNRLFPDGKPKGKPDPDKDPTGDVELGFARLFKEIERTADALIDLHNAWTGSLSFVYRDRVLYRSDKNAKANKAAAQALDKRLDGLCNAYGHSVVMEYPVGKYLDEKLHRSTSGAALNLARIPSFTVELGCGHMPDPAIRKACVSGLRNALRWAKMLGGSYDPSRGIKVMNPGYRCRQRRCPRVASPCIVKHLIEPGAMVKKGQPVLELRDIWGRELSQSPLRSEYDGWIVGRQHGIVFNSGQPAYVMAIKDDLPTVEPYPKSYFKPKKK